MKRICKVKGCGKKFHAKGYCRLHYSRFYLTGSAERTSCVNKGKVCKVPGCANPAKVLGYCSVHYSRWTKHRSFEQRGKGAKGSRNGNWKGGTSQYLNHYLMKKNRLIKLRDEDGKCEFCGKETNTVFHNDGSKDNHSFSNLTVACKKCGIRYLRKADNTSRYFREYGMTLQEMVDKYGGNFIRYTTMHEKEKLKEFLAGRRNGYK